MSREAFGSQPRVLLTATVLEERLRKRVEEIRRETRSEERRVWSIDWMWVIGN